MARAPRCLIVDRKASYIVSNRVNGQPDDETLADPEAASLLRQQLSTYFAVYAIRCKALKIIDGGLRMQVEVDPTRRIGRRELMRRAARLWPHPEEKLKTASDRRRFRQRLVSLSDFMRDVQGGWTRRFNHVHGRRGSMWAGRFHSTVLGKAAVAFAIEFVEGAAEDFPSCIGGRRGNSSCRERCWRRRRWRELVEIWEWARVVGDRDLVEHCALRDRDRFRWEIVPFVPGLWTLVEPSRAVPKCCS